MGSKFGAEQQTPTDSRSSKCSARRPLRARSTSPDRASLRSARTKPEATAPFRRRPCASRASSRPTGLDRAPFAPGRPEKGILAPRRPRTNPGLANARESAPLAASTATVLEASACPSYKFRPAQKSGPFRVVPDSVCDPHTILLHGVLSNFRSRAMRQLEIIAPRHQLDVLRRNQPSQWLGHPKYQGFCAERSL